MSKYLIEIEVDEEALKATNEESDSDEEDYDDDEGNDVPNDDDIEGLIEREMGWVSSSGIYLLGIVKKLEE